MTAQPPMSPATVSVLTALLEARTGQQLAAYRSWRLDTALKPVLKQRGIQSLDELVALLLDGQDASVADQVVDALVNSESSFFRDVAVFDLVTAAVAGVEAQGRRARIWCAGCATGQEPLSLAMLFAERAKDTGAAIPEIVATDVSEAALTRARAGRYTQFEAQRGLPIRRLMTWFDGTPDSDWLAKPELVRHVRYLRMNLVADPAPPGRFDLVLCRNVLLYLSPQVKPAVFARLAGALRPEGLLVLGAGETVIGQTRLFEPSRDIRGLYAKAAAAALAA
jgi:chemotaxis protein methyltransferase CheR